MTVSFSQNSLLHAINQSSAVGYVSTSHLPDSDIFFFNRLGAVRVNVRKQALEYNAKQNILK
jgi:hypothetical protein